MQPSAYKLFGLGIGFIPFLDSLYSLDRHIHSCLTDLRISASGNLSLYRAPFHPQPALFTRASLNLVLLELHSLLVSV